MLRQFLKTKERSQIGEVSSRSKELFECGKEDVKPQWAIRNLLKKDCMRPAPLTLPQVVSVHLVVTRSQTKGHKLIQCQISMSSHWGTFPPNNSTTTC